MVLWDDLPGLSVFSSFFRVRLSSVLDRGQTYVSPDTKFLRENTRETLKEEMNTRDGSVQFRPFFFRPTDNLGAGLHAEGVLMGPGLEFEGRNDPPGTGSGRPASGPSLFPRLILCCINADVRVQIPTCQHFSRSIRKIIFSKKSFAKSLQFFFARFLQFFLKLHLSQ